MEHIIKNNLINDYISTFNTLNESNLKYDSIAFDYTYDSDINILKEFNINFKQIKKIILYDCRPGPEPKFNFNNFYQKFFSLGIEQNLIYLSLGHKLYSPPDIEAELFNTCINNFKSLKHLELYNIKFKNTFIFK